MITKVYTLNRISVINIPSLRRVLAKYQNQNDITFTEEKKGTKVSFTVTAHTYFHEAMADHFDSAGISYEAQAR